MVHDLVVAMRQLRMQMIVDLATEGIYDVLLEKDCACMRACSCNGHQHDEVPHDRGDRGNCLPLTPTGTLLHEQQFPVGACHEARLR